MVVHTKTSSILYLGILLLVAVGVGYFLFRASSQLTEIGQPTNLRSTGLVTEIKNSLSKKNNEIQTVASQFRSTEGCYHFMAQDYRTEIARMHSEIPLEVFEKLPTDWQYATVCTNTTIRELLVIETWLKPSDEAKARTRAAFPITSSHYVSDGDETMSGYAFFLYTPYDNPIEITQGLKTKIIPPHEIVPIIELAWSSALASCFYQNTGMLFNGKFTVSCGGGDNGCYDIERASFDLFSGKVERLGTCKKNCDLPKDEPNAIRCSQ